jgi:tyrosyl-DNA phosphodiesterase 2
MMDTRLVPGRFDRQTNQWQFYPEVSQEPFEGTQLKVITYNVWFSGFARAERTEALLQLLNEADADIIALQEVTPELLDQIMAAAWVRASYTVSDITGGSVDPYGVLMLSRIPLVCWRLDVLPTVMGRMLLSGELQAHGTRFRIATIHLESTIDAASIRTRQLARIFPLLAEAPHALLMGDFNFCSSWPQENSQIDPGYRDLWNAIHPGQPGYTIDTSRNTMRLEQHHKQKQVCFDRIILRSQAPGWSAASIEVIGTTPIMAGPPATFVSDHFGLCATLERR